MTSDTAIFRISKTRDAFFALHRHDCNFERGSRKRNDTFAHAHPAF